MNTSDINSMYGFELIEAVPAYVVLRVPSGYVIRISKLPPYMFEYVDLPEHNDPGQFMITVRLLEKTQPPGIEQRVAYVPPMEDGKPMEPDRTEFEKEWMYFQQWKQHQLERNRLAELRGKRRFDFAMINCVKVESGITTVGDDDWIQPLLYMTDAPKNDGERLLMFLKTQVVTTFVTGEVVRYLMNVEEVTMQGIKKALDMFRSGGQWAEIINTIGQLT